ncbi:MAG: formylglycine-generating enzyme family protein [Spirochaetaceae bacterium]|jgi:formylglycine-generating enzyme required for sulfatase activity|nr:formylglycine-generating enzyme family protein [Spirochaetaceae bacterium]
MKQLSRLGLFMGLLSLAMSVSGQVQSKQRLTVVPFTSDRTTEKGGDEETLVVLLANHEDIRNAFTVVPPPGAFSSIIREIQSGSGNTGFGYTDANRFNAGLVLSVHTRKIKNTNLALISLVDAKTLQLLAGYYVQYQAVRELRTLLPDIISRLKISVRANQNADKLTVMPPYTAMPQDAVLGKEEADLLSEALTIELANSGKYAVFPWDLARTVEPKVPYSGIIDPAVIREMGKTTGSQYILTGDLLNLGTTNLFRTGIVQTDEGSFISEGDIEYRYISEELGLLPQLASQLLDIKEEDIALGQLPLQQNLGISPLPVLPSQPGRTSSPPGEAPIDLRRFVRIEAGTFMMGSPASEVSRDRDEVPHQAVVGAFYMGKYEITQAEYETIMGVNPSYFKGPNLPVEQVSWFDAVVYCNRRSQQEGLTPVYTIQEEEIIWNHNANGYRLPTEAEWEYACRAGTTTAYNLGDNITSIQVNYDGNYPYNRASKGIYREKTAEVGTFSPNAWGLYDMHGNVYEWCWDQYKPYSESGLNGSMLADAVLRGGSWFSEARFLRSANRVRAAHDARAYYIGFRVARSIFTGAAP